MASRTAAGGLTWLSSDHQGTAQVAINATTQAFTVRRQTPYGSPRGTQPTWPNDKGFVGGTVDNTGLTHLGAREYDPMIGRFISVDPIMRLTDPQQMHGYTYANNSPITLSDPSGLAPPICLEECGSADDEQFQKGQRADDARDRAQREADARHKQHECRLMGECHQHDDVGQTVVKADDKKVITLDTLSYMYFGVGFTGLQRWQMEQVLAEAWCISQPKECREYLAQQDKLLLDLIGVTDAVDCAQGSVSGCAWTAAGFIPVGKLKSLILVGRAGIAARKADDVPWSCFKSFGEDTPVLMADGTTKPISEIKVGDEVFATDPETGEQGARTVTQIWIHNDELIVLRVGDSYVLTTADHPFWNATDGEWQDAVDLDLGDRLLAADGTSPVAGGLLLSTRRTADAYNLTVADIHTYYVLAGKTPVLVHNSGPCDIDPATPTGGQGNPLLTRTPNQPGTINGRDYSGHALDRMQQQGIMPSVVENATRGPAIPGKVPGTTAYYDSANNITVITNSTSGRVVTVDYGMIRQ